MKGLLWKRWYDNILCWMDNSTDKEWWGKKLLPPVGATLDLTNACNLRCNFCNAAHYRNKKFISFERAIKIIKMLDNWGVKSICFAGGGEPTLHPKFIDILEFTGENTNMEIGISTNGTYIDSIVFHISSAINKHARFCGFSIDSATFKTWKRIKKGTEEMHFRLLHNAFYLNDLAKYSKLDTTFKFMICPENQHEIYKAAKLAKSLDFKNFYVRCAAIENVPIFKGKENKIKFDVKSILKQIKKAESLEDENFKVYASFNRVNKEFKRCLKFKKCLATPIIAMICADGNAYACIDKRMDSDYKLCKAENLPKFWGSKKHKKKIEWINKNLDKCPRCAFSNYNQQIEAYSQDYMFWKFP